MKKFSMFQAPFLSFFSRDLYVDVGLEWRGTGLLYLFLLLAMCWIPVFPRLDKAVSNLVNNDAPKVVSQIPVITITNGQVFVDVPQPYYINMPNTNEVLFIVDTTGKTTSLDDTAAVGLVTKTGVIIRKSEEETQRFDFHEVEAFRLDQHQVDEWLKTLERVVTYPMVLAISYAYRLVQVMLYTAIGLFFSSLCRARLSVLSVMRLTVIAITPCILVNTLLLSAGLALPAERLWHFVGAMGYLFFGMSAVSKEQAVVTES